MEIQYKSFTQPSPLYEKSLVLRNRVLIESVGRHENCRDFDFPDRDIYISAYDGNTLIGAAIVREFERIALEYGYSNVILHARETALPFYEKLGYELVSDKFYEIEIVHYEMRKDLL